MKEFWALVSFEYRKILGKRSVKIALLLTLFLSVFSIWGTLMGSYYIEGELFESNAEAMKKDRAYARELSGRILDDKLLMEAADAYQTIPDSAAVYQSTEEYQKNARKYSSIYSLARQVYDTPNVRFGAPEMGTLDPARAEQFYEIRELCMTKQIENAPISENAKEVMMQYSVEVKEPWIFSYSDGYTRFMTIMATSGVMAAFVMVICLAPLFAGEYSNHTDQLLLSARYGKGKLIKAKFFTGFSMTRIVTLLITFAVLCSIHADIWIRRRQCQCTNLRRPVSLSAHAETSCAFTKYLRIFCLHVYVRFDHVFLFQNEVGIWRDHTVGAALMRPDVRQSVSIPASWLPALPSDAGKYDAV